MILELIAHTAFWGGLAGLAIAAWFALTRKRRLAAKCAGVAVAALVIAVATGSYIVQGIVRQQNIAHHANAIADEEARRQGWETAELYNVNWMRGSHYVFFYRQTNAPDGHVSV